MNCPVEIFLEIPDEMKMWFVSQNRDPQLPLNEFKSLSGQIQQAVFLQNVNKQSGVRLNNLTTECWEWTGVFGKNGYGQLQSNWGKEYGTYAHRISYTLFNGEIPEKQLIRHKCDNRKCVNPEHLEIGTKKENNQDARERNPKASGKKLQEEELPKIADRMKNGEPLKEIAKDYGMNWKCISRRLAAANLRPVYSHRAKVTEEMIAEMRRMRNAGATLHAIGTAVGVSSGCVCEYLGPAPPPPTPPPKENKATRNIQIRKDFAEGVTKPDLCEKYGIKIAMLYIILRG